MNKGKRNADASGKLGWNPIESAPLYEDVTLQVTDGRGEPYTLLDPSRLIAAGWVSSGKGTPLAVTPVKWRRYLPARSRRPGTFIGPARGHGKTKAEGVDEGGRLQRVLPTRPMHKTRSS